MVNSQRLRRSPPQNFSNPSHYAKFSGIYLLERFLVSLTSKQQQKVFLYVNKLKSPFHFPPGSDCNNAN